MRTESEVHKRYRALRYELRRDLLRESLAVEPCNCTHNLLEITENEAGKDISVRYCMLGAEDIQNWPGNLCDTTENARSCPFFDPRHTRESVLEGLENTLQSDEGVEVYPELVTLQWVLEASEPILPWYERLVEWLRGPTVPEDEGPPLLESELELESELKASVT